MVMLYFLHMTNVEERCERQLFGQLVDGSKVMTVWQKMNIGQISNRARILRYQLWLYPLSQYFRMFELDLIVLCLDF